jgi:hypothetical protein
MKEHAITCPHCGKDIALTRALRAEIEDSLRAQFDERVSAEVARARQEAQQAAEGRIAHEVCALREQLTEQTKALDEARRHELALRKRERELERRQEDLELTVTRELDGQRAQLIADAQARAAEQHRLKDAEKERQLSDLRRQIEELKRKAEQGSQQLQGEVGECELEAVLRSSFPTDDVRAVAQGVRGADLQHTVIDSRGVRCATILWECKNARNWSDAWLAKLKGDQRAMNADLAVLVTTSLPRGVLRFGMMDGVLVCDFTSASGIAALVRANLLQLSQARNAAINKGEKLELLHRYLSGVSFRQRVEAVVESFAAMRADLEQERRAAERAWSRRARQIDAVTLGIAGMYGDLQGLVPALPPIPSLEAPGGEEADQVA